MAQISQYIEALKARGLAPGTNEYYQEFFKLYHSQGDPTVSYPGGASNDPGGVYEASVKYWDYYTPAVTEQRQAEEARQAAYWDRRRAENEQAKASFGGTRTEGMLSPVGAIVPGSQAEAKKQMLESGTAQWESPEAYSKAAGQFEATTGREGVHADLPVDREGSIQFYGIEGAPGYQTSKEASEARLTAINAAAAARAGEGIQQNKAYTDWQQPTELNPITGKPWSAPETPEDQSAYAADWWGKLSTADKVKAGAITITGNILSGTADYLGIRDTFDPMSGFELESAKAGEKQYTYQTVKQPESKGFGDFQLLAYQTVKPKWEAVAEARKAGGEVAAVKYAVTDTILSNEAVQVTGGIAAFGAGLAAVSVVSPTVAAVVGTGAVVAGVGSAGIKAATGQAREGFIEGVPFLLMAGQVKGHVKGTKAPGATITAKMFGTTRDPITRAIFGEKPPEVNTPFRELAFGTKRDPITKAILGEGAPKPQPIPVSAYMFGATRDPITTAVLGEKPPPTPPFSEVVTWMFGSKKAVTGAAAGVGAVVATQSARGAPSESDYQKAYDVAKDVSTRPEYVNDVIRVNEPRSPAKVETLQNKAGADAYGRKLAAELKDAGVNVEYNPRTGTVERVPDKFDINKGKEKVLDIEYFNKAKEQQKTKFNKDFGSEDLTGMTSKKKRIYAIGDIQRTPFSSAPVMPGQQLLRQGGGLGNRPRMPAERLAEEFLPPSRRETFLIASKKGAYLTGKTIPAKSKGKGFTELKSKWSEREKKNIEDMAKGNFQRSKSGQIVIQKQEVRQELKPIQKQRQDQAVKGVSIEDAAVKTRQKQRTAQTFATPTIEKEKERQATRQKTQQLIYIAPVERTMTGGAVTGKEITASLSKTLQKERTGMSERTGLKELEKTMERVITVPKEAQRTAERTKEKTVTKQITNTVRVQVPKIPTPKTKGISGGGEKVGKKYREYSNPIIKPLQGFKRPSKKGKKRGK